MIGSPTQPNSRTSFFRSVKTPAVRQSKTSALPYFGRQAQTPAPSVPSQPQLQDFIPALQQAMPDYAQAIDKDFIENCTNYLSTKRAQAQVNHLVKQIEPKDIIQLAEKDKLGLVEESSDMFFELYTLKALSSRLITKEMVQDWIKALPDVMNGPHPITDEELRSGKRFQAFREKIRTDIAKNAPPRRLAGFEKAVNANWSAKANNDNANRALDLLSLIGMKFTLMSRKDSNYSIFWDNLGLLMAEGEEFAFPISENFSGELKKGLVAGLARLYTFMPFLPVSPFRFCILNIVQSELGKKEYDVRYKDLMETVYSKQIGRQELDFSRPDIDEKQKTDPASTTEKQRLSRGNQDRKCIVKPIELMQEVAVLKNAERANANSHKATELVLNTQA